MWSFIIRKELGQVLFGTYFWSYRKFYLDDDRVRYCSMLWVFCFSIWIPPLNTINFFRIEIRRNQEGSSTRRQYGINTHKKTDIFMWIVFSSKTYLFLFMKWAWLHLKIITTDFIVAESFSKYSRISCSSRKGFWPQDKI